jgi:hypothetical protein
VGSGTASMDDPLGDALAIECLQLVDQMQVLQ